MERRRMFGRKFSPLVLILLLISPMILAFNVQVGGAIISKATYIIAVTWGDQTFNVIIETTSTLISGFYFSQPNAEIGFNVTGPDGAYRSSNVTIPKSLLWVDNALEWRVLMDNAPLSPFIFFNGTHTTFYLHYTQSTHKIQILGTHTVGPLPERKAGVKAGDWAKYSFAFNYTTNDPNPPIFPPSNGFQNVDYVKAEVLAVGGSVITFRFILHFKNDTETSNSMNVDVTNGTGSAYLFIGANLSAGDRIYLNPYSPKINATLMRMYAGAEREVNYVGRIQNITLPDYQDISEQHFYWDKMTGALDEIIENLQNIKPTEGYVSKAFVHLVLTETNIWTSEKILLGSGWGWLRISPRHIIFGKAELYKIGDKQIELVITCHGREYSRTWEIVRYKENNHNELYLCRSKQYGVLTVTLHHAKRAFWLAVGRNILASGPLSAGTSHHCNIE